MKAEIITIGDEILIGDTIDTNSAWIAKNLNLIGVFVSQIVSVSDERNHILSALKRANESADVVIVTGGLGPTKDDITKSVLVEYTSDKLVFNESVFNQINSYFEARGREAGEHNRNQAMVPSKCEVLSNRNGTAPGMWFETGNRLIISLPGVPMEMKSIMNEHVLDKLSFRANRLEILHKYILTQGVPESILMQYIESWENALPEPLKLAYLPSAGMVKLRISAAVSGNRNSIEELIRVQVNELEKLVPQYITGYDNDSLQATVGKLLRKHTLTLSTAESCTGGYIAHLITSVSGSSDYFKGSVVAYHNDVKQLALKVPGELLEKYGAVSQEVVEAMLNGILEFTGTDYAIATTGVAGPLGGSAEKPVGTVWIAVGSKEKVVVKKCLFGNERNSNVERTAVTALNMLRKEIMATVVI